MMARDVYRSEDWKDAVTWPWLSPFMLEDPNVTPTDATDPDEDAPDSDAPSDAAPEAAQVEPYEPAEGEPG